MPYIAGELLALSGLPIPSVLGVIYGVSLLVGAVGAGALADDLWGGWAGWVAAVVYGLGPYVLLDVLRRGNMPESVALAVLPWLFLSVRRLILTGERRAFITTSLLLTGLFLSHNISSLLLAPFLGLYTIVLSIIHRQRGHWPRAFLAVGLAVLIAAWFWLPALTEQDFVQLHLSRTTRNNDFHFNFLTWGEMLFALPSTYDPDYLNPPMYIHLGLGAGLLGFLGFVGILWRGRSAARRWLAVLFGCVALGYLWLSTPSSVTVWESVPMLPFVQFPWRMVGRALLPMSLLAGAVVGDDVSFLFSRRSNGSSTRIRAYLTLALVVVLVLLAWPRTFPPKGMCAQEPYPTIEDVYAYERAGWIGIDPESSYFPIWVETHPEAFDLAEDFMQGKLPTRLDAAALPSGSTIDDVVYRPLRASLILSSPEAFRARWKELYFPGWKVKIDGELVPISPEEDSGFITFPVPAGTHKVDIGFGPTPIRTGAMILTGLGFLGWVGAVFVFDWPALRFSEPIPNFSQGDRTVKILWLGAVSVITMARLLLGWLDVAIPASRERMGRLPENVTSVAQSYDGGLDLMGASLESRTLLADEELRVDLLWAARETPTYEYLTSVLLVGPEGRTWSPAGTLRPRGYETPPPTTMWQPGQYAFDPHLVSPLPGTPPGTYDVVVSLFDRNTLEPAMLVGPQGAPLGSELVLGEVEVVRPSIPFSMSDFGVSPSDIIAGDCQGIGLRSMTLDREEGAPGDIVAVQWVWEAVASPQRAHKATVALVGSEDRIWDTWTLPTVTDWWATDQWKEGDRWLGQHVLRLPGSLDTGTYTFVIIMDGCEAPVAQESLKVQSPERRWTMPSEFVGTDVLFGDQIRLAGYRIDPPDIEAGDTLDVSLAWQAVVEIETSYRVFVHLLDAEGRMIDQSDGIPDSWRRPTPGWAVDEVVVETRSLTLPDDLGAGDYEIQVGIYREDGVRLVTEEGEDHVVLHTMALPSGEP